MTVFTYGEGGGLSHFEVKATAGAADFSGALVITTAGVVSVNGSQVASGAARFSSTVSLETTTTAGIVVKTTAALQMPQTSLSAVTTIDAATGKISLTVRFPVVGANGIVYYLLGTVSAV